MHFYTFSFNYKINSEAKPFYTLREQIVNTSKAEQVMETKTVKNNTNLFCKCKTT